MFPARPQTAACPAPPSVGFSRQESWSGLPCPPAGELPDPGVKAGSPALPADSLLLRHQGQPLPLSGPASPCIRRVKAQRQNREETPREHTVLVTVGRRRSPSPALRSAGRSWSSFGWHLLTTRYLPSIVLRHCFCTCLAEDTETREMKCLI